MGHYFFSLGTGEGRVAVDKCGVVAVDGWGGVEVERWGGEEVKEAEHE